MRKSLFNAIWFLSLLVFTAQGAMALEIDVVSWNVESGGADPDTISNTIEEMDSIEIWGLSEVKDEAWANSFLEAAAEGESADYQMVLGTTGRSDKLLIIYNSSVFDKINQFELHEINSLGKVRAPLVVHLREKNTGFEFLFMVNHLYRSKADKRHEQSTQLNQWAQGQVLPIIATGDYNYDWNLPSGDNNHDQGYDNLINNGVFKWVRPAELVKTQCSAYNSVLDFIFLSDDAIGWIASSVILENQNDYCPDDDRTSDHRPILASFKIESGSEIGKKQQILKKIEQLRKELEALQSIVVGM